MSDHGLKLEFQHTIFIKTGQILTRNRLPIPDAGHQLYVHFEKSLGNHQGILPNYPTSVKVPTLNILVITIYKTSVLFSTKVLEENTNVDPFL